MNMPAHLFKLVSIYLYWFPSEMSKNGFLASILRSRILKFLENFNIKIEIVEIGKKYSKSISKFLKKLEEFNINIKFFEMSIAESISISRFLKCVQNFKTKINFIEKVLEYSISKSKFLKIP